MSFNTYGNKRRDIGWKPVPVWRKVNEVYQGGGTLIVKSDFKTEYPVGTFIPAGTPVYINKSGGVVVAVPTFELAAELKSTDTKVVFKAGATIPAVKKGMFVMLAPSAASATGTAYAIGDTTENADGKLEVSISAGAMGSAPVNSIFVLADKSGAGAKIAAVPNGYLWHDVVVEDGDNAATCAVVIDGVLMADRVSPIPLVVSAGIPNVILEREV